MQNDPSVISDVPIQAVEVTQALSMVDTYTNQATTKLAQVATIIGGESAAKFGFSNENIKRVLMAIGAYASFKFLTTNDKVLKYKYHILGSAVAIIAIRYYMNSGKPVSQIASSPVAPLQIPQSVTPTTQS